MARAPLIRLVVAALLLVGPDMRPARAEGQIVTPVGVDDKPLFSPDNPGVVRNVGGAGGATGGTVTNYPGVGTAPAVEGSSAPLPIPASAVQIGLVGANAARAGYWLVQDQCASTIYVVIDDGNGNALSTYVLAPASTTSGPIDGGQGGSMGSADTGPHLGRIRVFGPAGCHHSLRAQ